MGSYLPELNDALSHSSIALSLLQNIAGRWQLIIISDGLQKLAGNSVTKQALMEEWNTTYGHHQMHPVDRQRIREEFETRIWREDDVFDEVVRVKLHDSDEYSVVHMTGHITRNQYGFYIVVYHDDLSAALEQSMHVENDYENSLYHLAKDDNEAFAIIDRKSHVLYYNNLLMRDVLKPQGMYHPGITFEQYIYGEDTKQVINLERYAQNTEVLVENQETKDKFLMKVDLSTWKKHDVYLLKATWLDFRYFDTLTKFPNMNYFRMKASEMYHQIRLKKQVPTVIFLDVKGMKAYNRTYGFEAGDQLLKDTGNIIEKTFETFYTFRFSDDHFVVLAGNENLSEKIKTVATQVRSVSIDASVEIRAGIYTLNGTSENEVVGGCDKAKLACDSIKNSVDTYIKVYDDSLNRHAEIYDYVTTHIDEAIKNDWIKVYYQPVVRTLTDSLCSFEALSRWIDPVYGFLNPAEFIGALEDTHQIHKLDTYIINSICRQLRNRLDHHQRVVPVSFNLSRLDFTSCDIFAVVENALKENHISRNLVHVEITESIIADSVEIRAWASRFRNAGYEVWMDDFGSGYSSLNVLKDYNFDEIKFDMAFLSAFTPKSQTILTSTVEMAKKIQIQTLAEGVETEAEYKFLKEIGCEKVQGYYFGKPLPIDQAISHIHDIGLNVEENEWRHFYRVAGGVNMMRSIPLAIIEDNDNDLQIRYANESFRQLMERLGFHTTNEIEISLNQANGKVHQVYVELEQEVSQTQEIVSTLTIEENQMFIVNMREIIHQDQRRMLEVSMTLTDVSGVGNNLAEMNSFIVQMIMIYSDVNMFDYDADIIDGFVKDGTLYNSRNHHLSNIRRFRERYCERDIHPDDREAYRSFVNPQTLFDRIAVSKTHNVSHRFRVYDYKEGCYKWKLFTEARIVNKQHRQLLMELIKPSMLEEN